MHCQAIMFAIVAVGLSNCLAVEKTKAASSLINCGCQCSSLTFRDSAGVVQGNCKTVDGTGAQWCYVDSSLSSCQDLVPSQRFPHNPRSYQACATPAIGSILCPAHVHDHVHTPVIVVGHEHEEDHDDDHDDEHDDEHDDDHDDDHDFVGLFAPATPSYIHPDERLQTAASKSAGLVAPQK